MDLKQELEGNQTTIITMPSQEYNEAIVEVAKQFNGNSICYVTTNKTFDSLKEVFSKNGIGLDNTVFIDTISKTIKQTPEQGKNVYYISSPGALTEISLTISKFLKHEFDYLVFDSITNLVTYQEKGIVEKFIVSLINKVKESKTKSIFYALKINEQEGLIKKCQAMADKVIDLENKV